MTEYNILTVNIISKYLIFNNKSISYIRFSKPKFGKRLKYK